MIACGSMESSVLIFEFYDPRPPVQRGAYSFQLGCCLSRKLHSIYLVIEDFDNVRKGERKEFVNNFGRRSYIETRRHEKIAKSIPTHWGYVALNYSPGDVSDEPASRFITVSS